MTDGIWQDVLPGGGEKKTPIVKAIGVFSLVVPDQTDQIRELQRSENHPGMIGVGCPVLPGNSGNSLARLARPVPRGCSCFFFHRIVCHFCHAVFYICCQKPDLAANWTISRLNPSIIRLGRVPRHLSIVLKRFLSKARSVKQPARVQLLVSLDIVFSFRRHCPEDRSCECERGQSICRDDTSIAQ